MKGLWKVLKRRNSKHVNGSADDPAAPDDLDGVPLFDPAATSHTERWGANVEVSGQRGATDGKRNAEQHQLFVAQGDVSRATLAGSCGPEADSSASLGDPGGALGQDAASTIGNPDIASAALAPSDSQPEEDEDEEAVPRERAQSWEELSSSHLQPPKTEDACEEGPCFGAVPAPPLLLSAGVDFQSAPVSRWQVDVSRLSGARRALRAAPDVSTDTTTQSDMQTDDAPLPALKAPRSAPGSPALPSSPSSPGSLLSEDVAGEGPAAADESLAALVQSATQLRAEQLACAVAALASAWHLDGVLHAAHMYSSARQISTTQPPHATLDALLHVHQQLKGGVPLNRRHSLAAAWLDAALSAGPAPPPPSTRRTAALARSGSSPVFRAPIDPTAEASPIGSGGARVQQRKRGAVVTTCAPPRTPPLDRTPRGAVPGTQREGREIARAEGGHADGLENGGGWSTGAPSSAIGSPPESERAVRGSAGVEESSLEAEALPSPVNVACVGEAGSTGTDLETRLVDATEGQLVGVVGKVLADERAGDRKQRGGGGSDMRTKDDLWALLQRAHRQLAEIKDSSSDSRLTASASYAGEQIVMHLTSHISD